MFLDFDIHHDGYMLAVAIAVAEGLTIHSDVSAQYGPVTPLSQSLFLQFPLGEALGLRAWAAFHIAATFALIANLSRVWPDYWKLPRVVFPLSAVLWLLSSPVPANGYMAPWSSLQAGFMAVLALYLILGSLNWGFKIRGSRSLMLLAGVLIGLVPFTRINVGLALWMSIALILIVNRKLNLIPRPMHRSLLVGALSSAVFALLMLYASGALSAYLTQSIIGPLGWAVDAVDVSRWNTLNSIFELLLSVLPAAGVIVAAIYLFQMWPRRTRISRHSSHLWQLVIAGIALPITVAIFLSEIPILDYASGQNFTAQDFRSAVSHFIFGNQYSLVYLIGFGSVATWFWRLTVDRVDARKSAEDAGIVGHRLLVGLFSLAMLVQIVPTHDAAHMWWGSPLAALVLLSSASLTILRARMFRFFIAGTVVLQTLGFAAISAATITYPRFEAPPDGPTAGLYVRIDDLNRIQNARELGAAIPAGSQAAFITGDGFLAVANGDYLAASRNFVWWADPNQEVAEVLESVDFVVYQDGVIDGVQVPGLSKFFYPYGFSVVECMGDSCLLTRR